jgi:hypothetical protein
MESKNCKTGGCTRLPSRWKKEWSRMKRAQAVALIAGAALGLTGVTIGIVLSRKEGREAARRLLSQSSVVASQARQVGGQVAKTAVAQYQAQAPRAVEALNTVLAQAPQAAEAISSRLPKVVAVGK